MKIDDVISGEFLYETSNRFRGDAVLLGCEQTVYVASSVRLGNFIDINNKPCLFLKLNKNDKYKLIACDSNKDGRYTIVDLSLVNEIVKNYYESQGVKVCSEKKLTSNYRADLWVEKENVGIEIKSVILDKVQSFPSHNTTRIYKQLDEICNLLKSNKRIILLFVCNRKDIKLKFNVKDKLFTKKLNEARKRSLRLEYLYLYCDYEGNCFLERIDMIQK